MEWKMYLSLLLVTLQLYSSTAHPVTDPDTDRHLDSFKGVLERLEEKLSLIEALETSPEAMETRSEDRAQLVVTPDQAGAPLPETRATRNNPFSINDFFLKGLRSLQSPKMMRGSGCFGRRIDRIDSFSGLGCNGSRRN